MGLFLKPYFMMAWIDMMQSLKASAYYYSGKVVLGNAIIINYLSTWARTSNTISMLQPLNCLSIFFYKIRKNYEGWWKQVVKNVDCQKNEFFNVLVLSSFWSWSYFRMASLYAINVPAMQSEETRESMQLPKNAYRRLRLKSKNIFLTQPLYWRKISSVQTHSSVGLGCFAENAYTRIRRKMSEYHRNIRVDGSNQNNV